MTLQPYSKEELNFLKFASIVLDEFPKALREIFADMWDKKIAPRPGYQLWDDSTTVRNMFLKREGGKTKIPTNVSFQDWDCTALFQATLYAQTFALPDSKGRDRTLGELYIKTRKLTSAFHPNVNSPSGDPNETNALAIDQLRLLRNTLCHSSHSSITKTEFDNYVQLAKDAFTAVNVSTSRLEAIGNLAETDFPTAEVQKLNERIKDERGAFNQFLENEVKDVLNLRMDEVDEGIVGIRDSTKRIEKSVDEVKNHYPELGSKLDEMNENTKSNFSKLGQKIDELTLNQETVRGKCQTSEVRSAWAKLDDSVVIRTIGILTKFD